MKNTKCGFLGLSALLMIVLVQGSSAAPRACAQQQSMLDIRLDKNKGYSSLVAEADTDNNLTTLKVNTIGNDNKPQDSIVVKAADLAGARPAKNEIIIYKNDEHKRDIIFVASEEGFSTDEGGVLLMRYLVDGRNNNPVKRTYNKMSLELKVSPESKHWRIYLNDSTGRHELKAMRLVGNKKGVGPGAVIKVVVGIREIYGVTTDNKEILISKN